MIKVLTKEHESQIIDIINSHEKSVKTVKSEYRNQKIISHTLRSLDAENNYIIGWFDGETLISFLHAKVILGIPFWQLAYWTTRNTNRHFSKSGVIQLLDNCCEVMEDNKLYNFYLARPLKYGITKYLVQAKMTSRYTMTYDEIVLEGNKSNYALFNSIFFGDMKSPSDMVIMSLCLKPEHRKFDTMPESYYKYENPLPK